jgi:hypothetical protein
MDEESCLSVARKFLLDKGCSGTVLFCAIIVLTHLHIQYLS